MVKSWVAIVDGYIIIYGEDCNAYVLWGGYNNYTDVLHSKGALAATSSTEYCSHPRQRQVIIKYYIVQLKWSCYIFYSTDDDERLHYMNSLPCLWPCQPPPSSAHPRHCPINKNTFCKEVERVNPREEFLSAKRRQRASLIVSQFMALKREKIGPSRTISSYRWLSAVFKSFIRGCCCWLQLPCRIRNNMTIGKGRQRHQEKAAARDTRLLAKGWRKKGR